MGDLKRYIYEGPVMCFGVIRSKKWIGETMAVSKKKALSNLAYRYKKESNLVPATKIELDSKYLEDDE